MSMNQTLEVLELAGPKAALTFHLNARLFPPVGDAYDFATKAIDAVREGDPDRLVDDGISRQGRAGDVVDTWHLDVFCYDEGEEDE